MVAGCEVCCSVFAHLFSGGRVGGLMVEGVSVIGMFEGSRDMGVFVLGDW